MKTSGQDIVNEQLLLLFHRLPIPAAGVKSEAEAVRVTREHPVV